ncbi:hypothetical protein AMTR_s00042p00145750 [Amborella trichopoda]|uniref:Uncharacterized protein n=1 Tax=Amborella trichopoda TaxID=13333 RepID=W1P9C1_AMBTC|nr:hypothetical protein AMTR_s00042p00145750 [Amborella trichopoda]
MGGLKANPTLTIPVSGGLATGQGAAQRPPPLPPSSTPCHWRPSCRPPALTLTHSQATKPPIAPHKVALRSSTIIVHSDTGSLAADTHTRGGHKASPTHRYNLTSSLAAFQHIGWPKGHLPSCTLSQAASAHVQGLHKATFTHVHSLIGVLAISAHTQVGPKATHPSLTSHRRPGRRKLHPTCSYPTKGGKPWVGPKASPTTHKIHVTHMHILVATFMGSKGVGATTPLLPKLPLFIEPMSLP